MGKFQDILARAWLVCCVGWFCIVALLAYESFIAQVRSHATLAALFIEPLDSEDNYELIVRSKMFASKYSQDDPAINAMPWPPTDSDWGARQYLSARDAFDELKRRNDNFPVALVTNTAFFYCALAFVPMLLGPVIMMIGRFILTGKFTRSDPPRT